jgi:uncharacterized membrane protein YphA (DoxX/SURF4 family)
MKKLFKLFDHFIRFAVGGLFIFSGLIKLNDPVGTQIKLEEYFEVFSTDFGYVFEWFIPWALPIGMILIVAEVVLGIAVLINYQMRKTTWVLLLMILFFTFLTFYSAYFDKVTDCGCFGDAIKLTPWESFYKDIVLLVFVSHLFFYRGTYTSFFRTKEGHGVIVLVTIVSLYLGIYAVNHLPFIDFRPYKVGNNWPEQMIADEQPIIEYVFEKDGQEVISTKYMTEADGYKYINSYVKNQEATIPPITDYNVISVSGEDMTESTFQGIKLMVIIYNVRKADVDEMDEIKALLDALDGKIEIIAITASGEADFEAFRHEHQLAIPYYQADATVIKAMMRSNPGMLLIKDGTTLGKWHNNDIPSVGDIVDLL